MFRETYRVNSWEFFTFTCIHSLRLQKRGFSVRNRISPGLKVFHITLYLCYECSFVFFLDRLTANEKASISKAVLEIEANAVKTNEEAERSGQLIATRSIATS